MSKVMSRAILFEPKGAPDRSIVCAPGAFFRSLDDGLLANLFFYYYCHQTFPALPLFVFNNYQTRSPTVFCCGTWEAGPGSAVCAPTTA